MKTFIHQHYVMRLATGCILGILSSTSMTVAFAAPHWNRDVALNCETCISEQEHDIAVDPWGNGLVIWNEARPDFRETSLHTARYDNVTRTWSRPIRLGSNPGRNPEVAMDQYGNARAIWVERVGGTTRFMTARYSAASKSWEAPAVVHEAGGNALGGIVRFEMDRQGNGILMWQDYAGQEESGAPIYSVKARRYHAAEKRWGSPVRFDSGTSVSFGYDLAVDPAGNAIVVWADRSGIQWRRFRAATGQWGTPRFLATGSAPRIGLARSGGGVALWENNTVLYSAQYDPLKNIWSAPQQVLTSRLGPSQRDFTVDSKGNAFLVVGIAKESQFNGVTVQRYNATTRRWSAAQRLSGSVTSVFQSLEVFPELSADANGNAVAVWLEDVAGSARVTASRYSANFGFWSTPVRLQNASTARAPAVTYGGSNRAIAAWTQFTGNYIKHPHIPDATIPVFNVHANVMTP